jgi:hypothetical protein
MRNIGYLVIFWLIIFPSAGLAQDSIHDAAIDNLPPQFSLFEKQLFIENQKLRNASEPWYKGVWTPAFLSVLVAFAGVYVTRQFNNKQMENRRWELIQSSFNWLAGRTQNRNIGIAVAEHFWEKEPEYRKTWLRLFVNQAVYLLADQFDRKAQDHKRNPDEVLQRLDEELTLQRIMEKIVANK